MDIIMDRFKYIFGYPGMNFATTPPAVSGGAGSGSPPPDSSGGTGGTPALPTGGQPGTPGTGAPPAESPNIKQLRDQYEATRGKLEPWEKLGVQPSQVQQFQGVYQRVYDEAAAIGRNLGYADDEILEALHEDPVATLDYLRNQAFEQEGGGGEPDAARDEERRLQEMVNAGIERGLGPIQQRENIRMTNEANALFERTVHGLAVEEFKKDGVDVANIPPDEMELIISATSEIMKYDEGGLVALKREGKTAGIQKAFQEAKLYLDKYYVARSNRERARAGTGVGAGRGNQQQPPRQQDGNGKRPTLDEMIDDPSLINKKYQPGV